MTPPVCIYHALSAVSPCNDGLTAAWAMTEKHPDTELRPAIHGKPFPLDGLLGREVYFVDICPPRADLIELCKRASSVTVLDHHKTAEADLTGLTLANLTVVFDMNRSGAGIAWDHFHDHETRPWTVNVVEDNDLWRFALPESKALIEAIRSYPATIAEMGRLADTDPEKYMLSDGEAILRFKTIQVEQAVGLAHKVTFNHLGYDSPEAYTDLWVANVPFFLCSEVGNALAKKNQADFGVPLGITYYMGPNGKWPLSFRSLGGYDCSEIAKRFGGGGHKNASGANVETLPW